MGKVLAEITDREMLLEIELQVAVAIGREAPYFYLLVV
jgi:hypothetical protein